MWIHAETALLPEGWQNNVRLEIVDGKIASVATGVPAQAGDDRQQLLVPAMPNLHSHAFQRAMAGLVERRGETADSFWSWRKLMYHFALTMTPDQMEAIAAQLYMEMLEAGFGRVGEFHYLHHDRDGGHYANIAEMSERIASAASHTGIGLTLLPVLYAHAGFGGLAPVEGQRRFINGPDSFAQLFEAATRVVSTLPGGVIGVAPHSLRAVTPEELAFATRLAPSAPLHIHIAEQVREVEDCLAWSGQRPVEWLLDNADVTDRWCLIHATHMTQEETVGLARSGAVAGLCPVTEANLGDGTFPARQFIDAGGALGIGSDSNVLIGVADELRQLEYSQRLADRARNVLAPAGGSTGRALFDAAIVGGAQSLGTRAGIAEGLSADFLLLDTSAAPYLTRDDVLDGWIFAGLAKPDTVWINGRPVVRNGRHVQRDVISKRFLAAMRDLMLK
ncbi:formimidoylglutamate deiminase [Agrobacterium sp. fls2-241-TYG-188a]|uniref:formimidoylglutamate deiminase n=1 Tax=Agrobacterium sp. fls2-241-TYG-188a TaxID=3040275 RepID=UPI00254A7CA8|nr:formimidoylglutamate deiminase [Agrobacterium sp. fls2-241-TYG-188a]